MHMGSSTLVLEDFCEGMLFFERTLIPLCERGIWGEPPPPPSDEYSVSAMLRRDLAWLSFSFL